MKNKIIKKDDLIEIINMSRRKYSPNKVVLTNGCFDLIHVGHTRYLSAAADLGGSLVVAVNSDDSVKKLKGKSRPIFPLEERMELLASLACVDFVTSFSSKTCIPLINSIKPDIYVKGGDYNKENLPEWQAVKNIGGEVKFIEITADISTSGIIEKIISSHNTKG
ncbi:MAG: D-glycero-beta-D-manno-heptose 1-phosphate adenylyltransferase [Bacillota bacterium]